MTQQEQSIQESAVTSVIENAEHAISHLKNGAGKSTTCPSHEFMAKGIVVIAEMMIPVYRHVASQELPPEQNMIKTKWLQASGKALIPLAFVASVYLLCNTVEKWLLK
jgi:hypothetical protein